MLMMTAEFVLSKRPVLRLTVALFFLLKLFSSHVQWRTQDFSMGGSVTSHRDDVNLLQLQ